MDYNKAAEFGLQQLITRRLTTPGGLPAPTVAPEMFPVLALESDRPEWGVLKGERLAAAGGTINAVAAQNAAFGIFNPVGSGAIATLEGLSFTAASTVELHLTQQAFALAPVTANVRDARWVQPGAVAARPVLTCQAGTQVVAIADAVLARFPANATSRYEHAIVISPGWGLVVSLLTVNIAITAWYVAWRERGAQPGELA